MSWTPRVPRGNAAGAWVCGPVAVGVTGNWLVIGGEDRMGWKEQGERVALEVVKMDLQRVIHDVGRPYLERQVARDAAVRAQVMIEALPKG